MTRRRKHDEDTPPEPPANGVGGRYPEEEIIDAMEKAEQTSESAGKERADHFRAVTGRSGRTSDKGK